MKNILVAFFTIFLVYACGQRKQAEQKEPKKIDLVAIEKERVIKLADQYLTAEPLTVTAFSSDRSSGGIHDFYSEGDYWWPNPEDPDGPYIRKDGETNPDNFTKHRELMVRLSQISGALMSAYIVTKDEKYAKALIPHLKAWFIDENTKMNPSLLYGQAIKGRFTGRGIGIIDTIHLMEVAQAVYRMQQFGLIASDELEGVKEWFAAYTTWITEHPYGIDERDNGNNHSVCWAMQVASFATLTANDSLLNYCSKFYKETILPEQIHRIGYFPKEVSRTKPYGYSLFTLDAMATLCHILTTPEDNLFKYATEHGLNIRLAMNYMMPYVQDKNEWPYVKDVMYWDEWPVRHPWLLFGGLAYDHDSYLELWKKLDPNFTKQEVVRNMPIRYPLLWVDQG